MVAWVTDDRSIANGIKERTIQKVGGFLEIGFLQVVGDHAVVGVRLRFGLTVRNELLEVVHSIQEQFGDLDRIVNEELEKTAGPGPTFGVSRETIAFVCLCDLRESEDVVVSTGDLHGVQIGLQVLDQARQKRVVPGELGAADHVPDDLTGDRFVLASWAIRPTAVLTVVRGGG